MKVIKLKRLWNNLASIRDYVVQEAINTNTSIRVEVEGDRDYMILTPTDLKAKQFQILKSDFQSKYVSKQKYKLIDFPWKPSDNRQGSLLND